ncbi:hypothetical protein S245_017874, partial [Arachis hypogaea]
FVKELEFWEPISLHTRFVSIFSRGKGSRAVLKRLKRGVVVHDASYYTAVQVEGPE